MIALGMLSLDLMGAATVVAGLACTPGTGLTVSIAPGRLYSLQNVDGSAFGALAQDTVHQILKQAILLDAATLQCPAPATSGQSINYLIEAAYSDVDTNLSVLNYYNASNPTQPYVGPNNIPVPQATVRAGQISLFAKPGTAAATGTQTTPAADSGYVGLFVVTVANGATSITTGNIVQAGAAPFLNAVGASSGTCTLTGTGFSGTAPSVTARYNVNGNQVTLQVPLLTGTSNTTAFTATGLPTAIQPANTQVLAVPEAQNNSAYVAGAYASISGGTLSFGLLGSLTGWTNSGTKSAAGTFTYPLN